MARKRANVAPVTSQEIQAAAKALGLNVPVRAAERKGTRIVLHTRNGDYTWSPTAGAGGKKAPAKGEAK